MDKWMDGQIMERWMVETGWADGQVDGMVKRWMDGRMDDGKMNGLMDGIVEGWMGKLMEGWMDYE